MTPFFPGLFLTSYRAINDFTNGTSFNFRDLTRTVRTQWRWNGSLFFGGHWRGSLIGFGLFHFLFRNVFAVKQKETMMTEGRVANKVNLRLLENQTTNKR